MLEPKTWTEQKKKSVSVWWPAAAQILRKLPHFKGAVQEDWSFELCF